MCNPACIDRFIMNRLHWFLGRGRGLGSTMEHIDLFIQQNREEGDF